MQLSSQSILNNLEHISDFLKLLLIAAGIVVSPMIMHIWNFPLLDPDFTYSNVKL